MESDNRMDTEEADSYSSFLPFSVPQRQEIILSSCSSHKFTVFEYIWFLYQFYFSMSRLSFWLSNRWLILTGTWSHADQFQFFCPSPPFISVIYDTSLNVGRHHSMLHLIQTPTIFSPIHLATSYCYEKKSHFNGQSCETDAVWSTPVLAGVETNANS